jgi:hypothetical protein
MKKYATVGVIAAALGAIAWAGVAQGETSSKTEPTTNTRALATEWSASAAPMAAADVEYLRSRIPASYGEETRGIDMGPTRSEVAGSGYIAWDKGVNRVGVVPTSSGGLCFLASLNDAPSFGTCAEDFDAVGLAYGGIEHGGVGNFFYALAADDVDAIHLTSTTGKDYDLAIERNVVVWQGGRFEQPDTLKVTRGGKTFEVAVNAPEIGSKY